MGVRAAQMDFEGNEREVKMKRLWLLLLLPLMGCMTANQLAAEKSFYQAKIDMNKAVQAQPVFEMIAADLKQPIVISNVAAIRVFQTPSGSNDTLHQYQQKDYAQPWLNLIGAGLPWLGAWGIVKAVGDIAGGNSTTYNQNVSGQSTANMKVTGDFAPGIITGNNNVVGGMVDQTSVPTVVYQPTPIIVPPSYAP